MATELEIRWLEVVAQLSPRFIQSENKWAVAWENDHDREIERFDTKAAALAFVRGMKRAAA